MYVFQVETILLLVTVIGAISEALHNKEISIDIDRMAIESNPNVLSKVSKGSSQDVDLTVPQLLTKYGYGSESHEIVTRDGYILTIHRIPYGRNRSTLRNGDTNGKNKPVIFLQHGLLCSSADWLMNSVDKALGYRLADAGYDVWMGNARGNTYSRKHVSLSPKESAFWEFSFNEMGEIDIPAVLDYIESVTGESELDYIGHSMGTTMFWVAMSTHPQYQWKIKKMFALGPVAYLYRCLSPVRLLSPFSMDIEKAEMLMGDREFLPHSSIMKVFQRLLCEEKYLKEKICENIMFLLCGFDFPQLNQTMVPIILGHTPAGTSTRNIIHFLQMINSSKFRRFDYGRKTNLEIYGSCEPPNYNLSSIDIPVFLYWGENDWLAVKEDVYSLARELPNVILNQRVNLSTFNHLDFLYAIDSNQILYDKILNLLR